MEDESQAVHYSRCFSHIRLGERTPVGSFRGAQVAVVVHPDVAHARPIAGTVDSRDARGVYERRRSRVRYGRTGVH